MAITSFGTLRTKDQALAGFRSGTIHFTTLDISDRKVRFYGHTALVTSRAEVLATTPQGGIHGRSTSGMPTAHGRSSASKPAGFANLGSGKSAMIAAPKDPQEAARDNFRQVAVGLRPALPAHNLLQ